MRHSDLDGTAVAERAAHRRRTARIERLANLLDRRFRLPVIGGRFGLDALIGLIPGIGDAATAGLGAYVIAEAARGGARKRVLASMAFNTFVDMTLGAIPLIGDIFDFAFRSNTRNARLALKEFERLDRARSIQRGEASHGASP